LSHVEQVPALIRTIPTHRRIKVKLRRPPFWLLALGYAVIGSVIVVWLSL
jgi:hypothetical protein